MQAANISACLALFVVVGTATPSAMPGNPPPADGRGGYVHDLRAAGRLECKLCHSILSVDTKQKGGRAPNAAEAFAIYQVVDSAGGIAFSPSAVCLSCHDGLTGPKPPYAVSPLAPLIQPVETGKLRNHHPYSVRYQASEGVRLAPAEQVQAVGLKLYRRKDAILGEFRVECPTCHDVHKAGQAPLLRVDLYDVRSICRLCHRPPVRLTGSASAWHASAMAGYGYENPCLDCHDK